MASLADSFGNARPVLRRIACTLACTAPALAALPATADIFKCTDSAGNVTYQNEKCPTGTKAGRVDIFDNNWTANRSEREAEWQRNAADHRVLAGMPAKWVREALGEPKEIRETTTGGATELWVYSSPDRNVQVGMRDNEVVWSREGAAAAAAAKAAPSARKPSASASTLVPGTPGSGASGTNEISRVSDLPRDPETPRQAEPPRAQTVAQAPSAPRGAARGRDCKDVLAELGKPDSQREIAASDPSGSDAATEYVYEPVGASGRLRILCANGKVEGVDRSVAR